MAFTTATGNVGSVEATATISTDDIGKPNILLISIDDLPREILEMYDGTYVNSGWGGNFPYPSVPVIEQMVAEGVVFTSFRTNGPLCSQARANVLSGAGVMGHAMGAIGKIGNVTDSFEVPFKAPSPVIPTIARMVAGTPYEGNTMMIGKVHHTPAEYDEVNGYDFVREVYGFDKFAGVMRNLDNPPNLPDGSIGSHVNYWWVEDGVRELVENVVSSQKCQIRAQQMVDRNELTATGAIGEPWLMYMAFPVVHGPFREWFSAAEHQYGDDVADIGGNLWFNTKIRMMLEHLDARLLLMKNKMGAQWDNAIKIFFSDNGSENRAFQPGVADGFGNADEPFFPPTATNPDATLLSTVVPGEYDPDHCKGTTYEQGIGGALLVSHSSFVKSPGRVCDHMVDMVDIAPFICRVAGATVPPSVEGKETIYDVLRDSTAEETRKFSVGGRWAPNGFGQTRTYYDVYAVRKDDDGNMWKVIRRVIPELPVATPPVPDIDTLEFYQIDPDAHSGLGFLERPENELGTDHAEFAATHKILTDYLGSEYIPHSSESA